MNATVEDVTSHALAAGPTPDPPLARLDVIDTQAMNAFDRLPPKIVPLWWDATEAVDIVVDGATIARVAPTDRGQKVKYDLAPEVLELLCEQHGTDDDGATSDAFVAEGEAAVRAVLDATPAPPAVGEVSLRAWRGDRDSRLRQAEAVGRAHGLSGEAISRIIGRPFVARRTLLPPCSAVRRLEEKRAADIAAAKEREAEAEAVRVEMSRARTAGEMGWEVIEINARERAFGALVEPPFKNATMLARVGDLAWFGFQQIPGWELPCVTAEGIRVLARSEPVNHLRTPNDANFYDATFAQTLRATRGSGYDFGPIPRDRFSDKGVERAEELVRKHANALRAPMAPIAWRGPWLITYLVRGLLLRPDLAAQMLIRARDLGNRGAETADVMSDAISASCALAAVRGDVSAGVAFDPPASPSTHETKSDKKRAR
jgi:hypothetical protein